MRPLSPHLQRMMKSEYITRIIASLSGFTHAVKEGSSYGHLPLDRTFKLLGFHSFFVPFRINPKKFKAPISPSFIAIHLENPPIFTTHPHFSYRFNPSFQDNQVSSYI
jgi:hypothetical protein